MTLTVLAAALAGSIMTPANTDGLLQFADYPQVLLQNQRSSAALTSMFVDPDGHIIRCNVLSVTGDKSFKALPCRLAAKRKVQAARSSTGVPTYGAVTDLLRVFLPDSKEGQEIAALRVSPDAILTVSALPRGATRADIAILLEVDEAGKTIACAGKTPEVSSAFVKAACGASELLAISRESDSSGKAVPYVTEKRVAFVIDPESAAK